MTGTRESRAVWLRRENAKEYKVARSDKGDRDEGGGRVTACSVC